MKKYSVNELSELAGISVRTLHYYDQIGLLKPLIRTEAKYRFYGKEELLRLQQILFYKELDFPLKEIIEIMNEPEFDLIVALSNHKVALKARQNRIKLLIDTIDKTIHNQLKNKKTMLTPEELYAGLSKETATAYRTEAAEKYGKTTVETAEKSLRKMSKAQLMELRGEQEEITKALFAVKNEYVESDRVQELIARHYQITRKFWGTHGTSDSQAQQYKGLGELYVNDERFTVIDGNPQPEFAQFLSRAMTYFVKYKLD